MAIFSLYFYCLFVLYTLAAVLLFLPYVSLVRLLTSQRKTMRALRKSISLYGKGVIYGLVFPHIRVQYRDLGAGQTEEGACVFVCNHRSSADPFLMACLPVELVQVVNIWPFRIPILGVIARWAGYLSVREMSFDEFTARATTLLQEGVSIVAFPEGTRSGGRAMGQFHGGVFRLCVARGVPLVPVCIMGTEDKPPRSSMMLRSGVVKVDRLPAIRADQYEGMSAFRLKQLVRTVIMEHLEREEGPVPA